MAPLREDRDRPGETGKTSSESSDGGTPVDEGTLDLEHFLPYRLSVLAGTVSRALARVYEDEHNLSVAEWRLLAILARFGALSANGVCERTAMDKVRVSRAVARATANGLIHRAVDPGDRRRSVLSLTNKGRAIHDRIVPTAREREAQILAGLEEHEIPVLQEMLSRLYHHAREVESQVVQ